MTPQQIAKYFNAPTSACQKFFLIGIIVTGVLMVGATRQMAQDHSVTDGNTPSGMAAGNASGSYETSGIDSINFYNGNVNFSLPLLKVGGRGDASAALTFHLDSKSWRALNHEGTDPNTGLPVISHRADASAWYGPTSTYGPGSLAGRSSTDGLNTVDCQLAGGGVNRGVWKTTLTRLTFIGPDGSEIELRDASTEGEPKTMSDPCTGGYNRGKIFVSHNGSGAQFVSDTNVIDYNKTTGATSNPYQKIFPSGYMFLANGTRIRIDLGKITWLRDRNGNKINFGYDTQSRVTTITDALGRQSTVAYGSASDLISFAGYNGATRVITVNHDTLGNCLKSGEALSSIYNLFSPMGNTSQTATFNPTVTSSIELPDGRSYQFQYNKYGEVAKVVLPTGGSYEYDYTAGSGVITAGDYGVEIYRRVTTKRTYSDASSSSSLTGTMTVGSQPTGSCSDLCGSVEVKQFAGDGTTVTKDLHYFSGDPLESFANTSTFGYTAWLEGKEFQTRSYQVNSSTSFTELRRTDTTYQQREPIPWTNGNVPEPANDTRPSKTVSTMIDAGLKSKQTFGYEASIPYNNQTDVYEYDFGSNEATLPLKRHTHTNYLHTNVISGTTYTYDAVQFDTGGNLDLTNTTYIRGLVKDKYIYGVNTSGQELTTPAARSEIAYDEPTYLINDYSTVTQWTTPGIARGNATTSKTWYDASNAGAYYQTHVKYDQCGNPRTVWDANNHYSEIEYWSYNNSYAFPTLTRSTVPDTSGLYGSTAPFVSTNTYDFASGLALSSTDENGVVSTTEYNDYLDRPTKQTAAYGTSLQSQSTIGYDDASHKVTVTSDLNALNDNLLKTVSFYDGLGRTVESRDYEANGNYRAVQTQYDSLGRAYKQSNPFRPNDTVYWTTQSFDSIGRSTQTQSPDGAVVLTAYDGPRTLVIDQAGKKRLSKANALGQLTDVWEITGADSATQSVSFPSQSFTAGYWTTYAYDPLNNLQTVAQGAQARSFTYNSLSRLTQATNPESGSTTYLYDNNGNLTQKTDSRGVRTDYIYDALNRVTQRNYSTPSGTPANYQAAPNVAYYYDNLANAKGKLTRVTNSDSTTEYTSFDILGRVTGHKQTTNGGEAAGYPTAYTYNLAGALIEETYPSTRVVKNVLDLDGQLLMVESKKNSASGYWSYANSFTYSAAGAVTSMQLGNGHWESTIFNNRLQPTQIALGTLPNGIDKLKLNYDYGTTANNGNVLSQTITVPTVGANTGFTAVQAYSYDELNRLKSANEKPSGWTDTNCTTDPSKCWKQAFSYDRYGNKNFDRANTTMPASFANPAVTDPSVNTANNRLNSSGYSFDNAGNMTADAGGQTYTYDGENKQVQASNGSGTLGQYWYDGEGKRVKKVVPGTGETTIFVFDAAGKQIAEYSSVVADVSTAKVAYLTDDALGSPRINTDQNGAIISRHDYHPFGEEIGGAGGRTTGVDYGDDTVRKQFTGYERDGETELDYAQARMYVKGLGRFTTTDPLLTTGRPYNPTSWNRYAFTLNNPLNLVDPSGLYECADGKDCNSDVDKKFEKELRNAQKYLNKIGNDYGINSDTYLNAKRGLDAYGAKGFVNGITVAFGKTAVGNATTGGLLDGDKKAITVTFDMTKLKDGSSFQGAIGHEGSHAQDRSDLAGEVLKAINGDFDFKNPATLAAYQNVIDNGAINLTSNQTETKAYGVTSVMAEYSLQSNQNLSLGDSGVLMAGDPAWANLDKAKLISQRGAAIASGLSKDSNYSKKASKDEFRFIAR